MKKNEKWIKLFINILLPSIFLNGYAFLIYTCEKHVKAFSWQIWSPTLLSVLVLLLGILSMLIMLIILRINRDEVSGLLFGSVVLGLVLLAFQTFSVWLSFPPVLRSVFRYSFSELYQVIVARGVFLMGYIWLAGRYLRNRYLHKKNSRNL